MCHMRFMTFMRPMEKYFTDEIFVTNRTQATLRSDYAECDRWVSHPTLRSGYECNQWGMNRNIISNNTLTILQLY